MNATIRRYAGVTGMTEELALAIRQLASSLSRAPGFVSFVVLEEETGVLATVSIFEDQPSLRDADGQVRASLPYTLAALLPDNPQVITGEIVFQRGM